ncbi:MAG: glycosyltransferase, partial [Candidatus Acidiferrales bacterium]
AIVDVGETRGIVFALNAGLPYCTGAFVARMDADDVALPERLERQVAFLRQHPDIALVGSAIASIDEQGNVRGSSPVPIEHSAITRSLKFGTPCFHPTWLARRTLYTKLGGYRDVAPCEDYDFLLRAVTSGEGIANLPDKLLKFRLRAGNSHAAYGLRQNKAHYYVRRLYEERLRGGADSFSVAGLDAALRTRRFEAAMYRVGERVHSNALASHKKGTRGVFFAVSALISPWHMRYFYDRLRWSIVARRRISGGAA